MFCGLFLLPEAIAEEIKFSVLLDATETEKREEPLAYNAF